MSEFTDRLIAACLEEYARWDNGAGRETHGTDTNPPARRDYYLFVGEYWNSIGINYNGRTIVEGKRPAWSSAFISFCVRRAGAGNRFKYSQAHCHYIHRAMEATDGQHAEYAYVAKRAADYRPRPGDIVCAGREYAKRYTYDQAKMIYVADTFYPSHGDVVVDVTATHAVVIGGNVIDNVDRKRLPLDSSGRLRDRVVNGTSYPWIAVLSCRI